MDSQASKHLDWCLKKAEREIEECKKHRKGIKHRGLVEIKPDIEEAEKHIRKAEHNFKAISNFKENGFSDWSVSAGFYCIYHCFLAIATRFGYVRNVIKICISEHPKNPKNKQEGFFDESRNQECTISLIECLKEEGKINIDSKFIEILKHQDIEEIQENNVIDMRENYTYGVETSVEDAKKISDLIKICKEMIDASKEVIFKNS